VQVIPQHAMEGVLVLSTRKIVTGRQQQQLRRSPSTTGAPTQLGSQLGSPVLLSG
jgi:hypothetical protein